jgi:DNA polymerase-3 subunit delta'
MTKEAQNCLLKTLEEPPEFVTIILIVSNENMILNTIKSRCLKIYFNNLSDEELKKYINENLENTKFSENMLKSAGGSIGKAISICKNTEIYLEIDKIFSNIENYSLIDVIPQLEILYKSKDEIQEIFHVFSSEYQ